MIHKHTHTHGGGLPTEAAAVNKAARGSASTKAKILEEIELLGYLTPDLFVEHHGGLINTVRRRFTDLWKEGKIRHHPKGLTRKNSAGNPCIYWVLGADPDVEVAYVPRPTVNYLRGFDDGIRYALAEMQRIDMIKQNGPISFARLLQHLTPGKSSKPAQTPDLTPSGGIHG